MQAFCVGINFRKCPIAVREKLGLGSSFVRSGLSPYDAIARQNIAIKENCLVATCNRSEWYGVAEADLSDNVLISSFLSLQGAVDDAARGYCYVLRAQDAVVHLFKVCAGLDSMVLGETQITGQVKEAFAAAVAHGAVGPTLNRLFSRSFAVNKAVRARTKVGEGGVSIASVAVELAQKVFSSLANHRILVIGLGEMGRLLAQHLKQQGCDDLVLCNRDLGKAKNIAEAVGAATLPFEDLRSSLHKFDAIFASLSYDEGYLFGPAELKGREQSKTLLCVDISLPRVVDPALGEMDQIFLYNIDDLDLVVKSNLKRREEELKSAMLVVDEESARFAQWLASVDAQQTIRLLKSKGNSIVAAELARIEHQVAGFPVGAREIIAEMAQRVANKLLHYPIVALRDEVEQYGSAASHERLRAVYQLDAGSDVEGEESPGQRPEL